jgi:NADH:ubiquinone oxidoreductase subunit E
MESIDQLVERYGTEQRALIPLLLHIQKENNYLPRELVEQLADRMKLPRIQVFQVASFYKAFSLKPRGRHILTVCLGTACHVRGGERILEHLERTLKVKAGATTADKQFTLEAVNCLGCCALGPVVVLDGVYSGQMDIMKVERLLKKLERGEATPQAQATAQPQAQQERQP